MKHRKLIAILTAAIMLVSFGSINAFAAESELSTYDAAIQAYCSSENFTLEGLQERFPDFYVACQREYAQDALMIQGIQNNMASLLSVGQQMAATDAKCNEVVSRGSTLGTYGDILVSLNIDSGSLALPDMQQSYLILNMKPLNRMRNLLVPSIKMVYRFMITIGALLQVPC